MGLGAMTHISSFLKIGSGTEKLVGSDAHTRIGTRTHRERGDLMGLILYFQKK
jgi:hypothetical protein